MNPSFLLWHPVITNDGTQCRLDATSYESQELASGTADLMADFLKSVDVVAQASRWRIEPFCSPYFSQNLAANEWMDRIVRAWHVVIDLESPHRGPPLPLLFRPYSAQANDATWAYDPDAWEWSERRAIVIAHYPVGAFETTLASFEADPAFSDCERIGEVTLAGRVRQRRFDLGMRRFPDDEAVVRKVMDAARAKFGAINWQTSIPLETIKTPPPPRP
jgi:hypothetical protein